MEKELFIFSASIPYGGGAVGVVAKSLDEAQEVANGCYKFGNDNAAFDLIFQAPIKTDEYGLIFEETTAE